MAAQADVAAPTPKRPVLLFDGVCGLCNRAVDFVMARDRSQQFLFAPLQGEYAAGVVGPEPDGGWQTLVLVADGQQYRRSDAALQIAKRLGWPWRAAMLFWLVPRPLRDWAYDFVAKRRMAWFGQKETCRLPTPAERARFLM